MRIQRIYYGSTPKYKIEISVDGFDMDADTWSITITGGGHSRTYAKSECIHNSNGWFIGIDTTEYGLGTYYATLTALVPDTDFTSGFRTEVEQLILCVVVDRPADSV